MSWVKVRGFGVYGLWFDGCVGVCVCMFCCSVFGLQVLVDGFVFRVWV